MSIIGLDGAAVEDRDFIGVLTVLFFKEITNGGVDDLGHFWGGGFACTDGPDGFVGDDKAICLIFRDGFEAFGELVLYGV